MTNNIQKRILDHGAGWVFSAADFIDIANRNNIDQTLFRLCKQGKIRKLTTGLYDFPIVNPKFGPIPPDPDKVADVLAKKFGYGIQLTPAQAANKLGLSLQVPVQPIYLTNGFSKIIKLGHQTLKFVHVSNKKLIGIGTKAGLIIQSLYYFGKDKIDSTIISKIKSLLQDNDKDDLIAFMPQTPVWMQNSLKKVIQDA